MPSTNDYNEICYLARYPDLRNGYIYQGSDGKYAYEQKLTKGPFLLSKKKLSDNAFWHWQNFGLAEGRVSGCDLPGTNYSNEFNAAAYLARYPDVRVSSGYHNNPLGHYQDHGIAEGRHPGYEILTSNSPAGMTSPGTTTTVNAPPGDITPGDGEVITDPILDPLGGGDAAPPVIAPTTDNTGDIGTWIAANPLLVAGIAAAILLLLHEKKKHPQRKHSHR